MPCRLWRVFGVALLLAQTGLDAYVYYDKGHAKRVTAACLAAPRPAVVEGVSCRWVTRRRLFRQRVGLPERLLDADAASWASSLAGLVWCFLCADIVVHLVSGHRVKGNLKPLAHGYVRSYWFAVDVLSVSPPLLNYASARSLAFAQHASGLDRPLTFILHHLPHKPPPGGKLIRPGKIIRKLLTWAVKFAFRNRRLIRALVSEAAVISEVAAVAKTAVQEAEVLVELTEQAEEVYEVQEEQET